MDRQVEVLVGDPLPEGPPPPNRRPLVGGLMVALVAFGVWGLVANQPAPSPDAVVSTTLPEAFPTTTIYHSPLDEGGGEILFPGSGSLEFVADGPAGLVAAGHNLYAGFPSFLWKAEDGRTWEYVKDSTEKFEKVRLTGLLGGPDGYVATGILTVGEYLFEARPMAWTSADGVSWLPAEGLPATGGIHRLVGIGNDLLVALGWEYGLQIDPFFHGDDTNPRIWISVGGHAWEEASIDIGQRGWFADVVWDGDVLVLGGSKDGEGRLWTSSDRGLTWELVEDDGVKWPIGVRFVAVTGGPDRAAFAIAAGSSTAVLWRRDDSGSWIRGEGLTNNANWIMWSESAGLITGRAQSQYDVVEPELLTSDGGQTWAAPNGFPTWQQVGRAVDIGGSVLIPGMIGDQPALWQWPGRPASIALAPSPWLERAVFASRPSNWQVLPWSEIGLILKVEADWLRWSDAGRWEPIFFEGAPPQWVSDLVATPQGWIMWGWDEVGSFIWRSFDGAHWAQTLTLDPGVYLSGIYELNGRIVAHGQDSQGEWFQATSTDGQEWAFKAANGPGLAKVLNTAAGYVGLTYFDGPPTISITNDGLTWEVMESLPPLQDIFTTPFGLMGLSGDGPLYKLAPDLSSAVQVDVPFEAGWSAGVTNTGLAVGTTSYPYDFWYTEDLENWIELPLNLEGGFPGTNPQFVGGVRVLVAGWDRGAVKIWEFQD